MDAQVPLAIVGGGRMGEAIVGGLLAAGSLDPGSIVVAEPDALRRSSLAEVHGVRCVPDGRDAVSGASTVLLAVKPQVIDDVVRSLADAVGLDTLVVSIAAGVTCARLEALLAPGTAVVRVMPNTPALVRQGMAVVSGGAAASAAQIEAVRSMFSSLGRALVLEERHQDAATAISGSGPAYVAIFVDALAAAGEREGLPREVAEQLAVQTLRGTADLLELTGQTPDELVAAVSSPGGTTVAATARLEAGGFRSSVGAAVAAAVERAKELGA
ncbi:MAG TPA: pyrroline-5-carboxylate reductase [Coriobacteriia bacterium]